MCNDDFIFRRIDTLIGDQLTVNRLHIQAVDHHQGSDDDLRTYTAARDHFRQMCFLEKKLSGDFIILLIKRAAGNEYADRHSAILGSEDKKYKSIGV